MALVPIIEEKNDLQDSDYIVAASGQQFDNDGMTVLWVKNESGAGITLTVVASVESDQGFLQPSVLTIPAGSIKKSLMYPISRFGRRVDLQWSSTSNISVIAVRQQFVFGPD